MDLDFCPFCGSNKTKVQVNRTYSYIRASGRCNSCHARGPIITKSLSSIKFNSIDEITNIEKDVKNLAIDKWNWRAH